MKQWSIAHLDKLKAEGKIRGYSIHSIKKEPQTANGRIVSKLFRKPVSKQKQWLEENLLYWCSSKGIQLIEEYKFWPERKFKSDWFIPDMNLLIEYEGGVFMQKSGHTKPAGYTKDLEKYNKASQLGFKLIRFNAINYRTLLTELNNIK